MKTRFLFIAAILCVVAIVFSWSQETPGGGGRLRTTNTATTGYYLRTDGTNNYWDIVAATSTNALPSYVVTNQQTTALNFPSTVNISTLNVTNAPGITAAGATVFVDAVNGSDSTGVRGNSAKPFLTLTNALRYATNGDIVFLRPGTYTNNATTNSVGTQPTSMAALNNRTNMVIQGSGPGTVIWSPQYGSTFSIFNSSNLVVRNLKIKGTYNEALEVAAFGVHFVGTNENITFDSVDFEDHSDHAFGSDHTVQDQANFVTVRNCKFSHYGQSYPGHALDADGAGIQVCGHNWIIEGCTFRDGFSGIELWNNTGGTTKNVMIRGNTFDTLYWYGIFGQSATYGLQIENNTFRNFVIPSSENGPITNRSDIAAIYVADGGEIQIRNNWIEDIRGGPWLPTGHGMGILIYRPRNVVISENQIRGAKLYGIAVLGSIGAHSNVVLQANTVVSNGHHGIYLYGGHNLQVRDNVVMDNGQLGVGRVGIYVQTGTNTVLSGNLSTNSAGSTAQTPDIQLDSAALDTKLIGNIYTSITDNGTRTRKFGDIGSGTNAVFTSVNIGLIDSSPTLAANNTFTVESGSFISLAAGAGLADNDDTPIEFDINAPSSGQLMQYHAASGRWTNATVAGSGDVTAASTFGTDNRVIRSDGTGKGVQASGVTLSDADAFSGITSLTSTVLQASSVVASSYTNTSLPTNAIVRVGPGGILTTSIIGSGLTLGADGTLSATGSGTPAGNSGAIQFNENGSFAGTNRLYYDRTNDLVRITGALDLTGAAGLERATITNRFAQESTYSTATNYTLDWAAQDIINLAPTGAITVAQANTPGASLTRGQRKTIYLLTANNFYYPSTWQTYDGRPLVLSSGRTNKIIVEYAGTNFFISGPDVSRIYSATISNNTAKPLVVGVGNAAGATNNTGEIRGIEAGSGISLSVNGSNVVVTATGSGSTNNAVQAMNYAEIGGGIVTNHLTVNGMVSNTAAIVPRVLTLVGGVIYGTNQIYETNIQGNLTISDSGLLSNVRYELRLTNNTSTITWPGAWRWIDSKSLASLGSGPVCQTGSYIISVMKDGNGTNAWMTAGPNLELAVGTAHLALSTNSGTVTFQVTNFTGTGSIVLSNAPNLTTPRSITPIVANGIAYTNTTISGVGGANTNFTGQATDSVVYIDGGTTNVNFVAIMPGTAGHTYFPTYVISNLTTTARTIALNNATTNYWRNLQQYDGITSPVTLTNKHTGILSVMINGSNTWWTWKQSTNGF